MQPRFYDSFEPTALLVRPGLTWRAPPELLLTAGYGWTPSWAQGNEPRDWGELAFTDEHRLWEQVIYQPSDRATGVAGVLRVRLEQRFRTEGEVDVGVRLASWRACKRPSRGAASSSWSCGTRPSSG